MGQMYDYLFICPPHMFFFFRRSACRHQELSTTPVLHGTRRLSIPRHVHFLYMPGIYVYTCICIYNKNEASLAQLRAHNSWKGVPSIYRTCYTYLSHPPLLIPLVVHFTINTSLGTRSVTRLEVVKLLLITALSYSVAASFNLCSGISLGTALQFILFKFIRIHVYEYILPLSANVVKLWT